MTGLLISLLVSQNLWAKTYEGEGREEANSIIQTYDGGFMVAGWTYSYGAINDPLLIKLSPSGEPEWARAFAMPAYEYAISVIQTSDSGYAFAGFSHSGYAIVIKLNSSGDVLWSKFLLNGEAWAITETSDKGLVVAGYYYASGSNTDLLIFKLDASGNLLWAKTLGGSYYDKLWSVTETSDGSLLFGGQANLGTGYGFLVLKTNSSGSPIWARLFKGAGAWDFARSVIQTADGNYAVAGWVDYLPGEDAFALKLTPSGTLLWAKTYGGTDADRAYSVTQLADGGLAIAGYTANYGSGGRDFFILKLDDSSGNPIWVRTLGGASHDDAFSVTRTSDGGLAVTGRTPGSITTGILVLRMGADGNYTDCVAGCAPTVSNLGFPVESPSIPQVSTLTLTDQSFTPGSFGVVTRDFCQPVRVDEQAPGRDPAGITCSPVPGGILFNSSDVMVIKIYSADGRVAYFGNLEKGQNRITLETGVYLWIVGAGPRACPPYKGKVVVR